jgi:hypothetical protein
VGWEERILVGSVQRGVLCMIYVSFGVGLDFVFQGCVR